MTKEAIAYTEEEINNWLFEKANYLEVKGHVKNLVYEFINTNNDYIFCSTFEKVKNKILNGVKPGSKFYTEKFVSTWLKNNIPNIILTEWSGKSVEKSIFYDIDKKKFFSKSFSVIKTQYKKGRCVSNTTNEEKQQACQSTFLKKYGVKHVFQNETIRKKAEQTMKKKYGEANASHIEKFIIKKKKTVKEKYGVDNILQNVEIKEKCKQTNLKKYGSEYYLQTKEFAEKKKNTCLEKYGSEYYSQTKEFAEKRKNTCLERYGKENPLQVDEIKEKCKQTNLKKYGVEHYPQTKEFAEKCKQTNLEKYGSEHYPQTKEFAEKRKNTCLERYGKENPLRVDEIRKKAEQTCLERYGVKNYSHSENYNKKIKETSLRKYGVEHPSQNAEIKNKIYNTKKNKGLIKIIDGKTIKEIAMEKKIGISTATQILSKYGKETLNSYEKGCSSIETKISFFLNEVGEEHIQDKYLPSTNIRPDFYLPLHNLIIECDGLYWHSDAVIENNSYHINKRKIYENLGITPLFLYEDELEYKFEICKSIIKNKLNMSEKIYARKCSFVNVDNKKGNDFFEKNHLMGKGSGRIYALLHENKIISAIQVKWKNKSQKILDISRFCNRMNYAIVGGFSKLLSHVIKNEGCRKISTFIDRRYGQGKYLDKLGFHLVSDYKSFYWVRGKKRQHRRTFLGNSGYEFGYNKIWDCGQDRWLLNVK